MTDSRVDEETPLLFSPDDTAVTTSGGSDKATTPLPKLQIGILLSVLADRAIMCPIHIPVHQPGKSPLRSHKVHP
jgi:hypothetical protein